MSKTSALPVPRSSKENLPNRRDFSIALHAWINGSEGSNRTRHPLSVRLIEADHDTDAVETWLGVKKGNSSHTLRSYRHEAYRLLAWSLWFREKPISSLTVADVADFHAWLLDPNTHPEWTRRGWVLIRGSLGTSSAYQALRILSGMFRWLVEAGYLAGNPFRLFDHCLTENGKHERAKISTERAFDKTLWDWMLAQIDTYKPVEQDNLEYRSFERTRFALIFMYWTGVYGQELLTANMSQITNLRGIWILKLKGRDEINREYVALLSPAIDALRRYRVSRGLSELPTPAEQNIPLVAAHRGKKSITDEYLNLLFKKMFTRLAEDAKHINNHWVEKLEAATTRWLRYTLVTHNAQTGVPIQNTTQQLRDKSMNSTRLIYNHIGGLEEQKKGLEKLLNQGAKIEIPDDGPFQP